MTKADNPNWVGYLSYHRNGFWIIDTYDHNRDMRSSYTSNKDYGEDLLNFVCRVLWYYSKRGLSLRVIRYG